MSASKPRKGANRIDTLMERASGALAKSRYFECERLANEALELAHVTHDYERMARILLALQEARRNRRLAAIDLKRITVLEEMPAEEASIAPGCYLVQPPLVGADGRELRERALHDDVPVLVVVREPKTRAGLWPVVMIGPITVRDRITPPRNESKVDMAWFIAASEALGDAAIAEVDPDLAPADRVAALLDRLNTVVDHEKLHQELMDACKAAAAAGDANPRKASSLPAEEDDENAGPDVDDTAAADVEADAPRPPRRRASRRAS